jgi:putative endopeptidase
MELLFIAVALATTASFAQTAPNRLRFDASAVDRTVDPCADFYQYACGTWKRTHAIPVDRSAWDPY